MYLYPEPITDQVMKDFEHRLLEVPRSITEAKGDDTVLVLTEFSHERRQMGISVTD